MHARKWVRRGLALVTIATLNLHGTVAVGQGAGHEYRQLHMGMEVRLMLHGTAPGTDAAARAAFTRIAALEEILSDWRPTSEVRRLTERVGQPTPLSPELFAVLTKALNLAAASGGAFDPTVGPLVTLWREARRTGRRPADAALAEARGKVGWHLLDLDTLHHTLRIPVPGMQLDLGAIAKGWILGEAAVTLRANGVTAFLIEAGGDLLLGDAPAGSQGWKIGIATARGDSTVVLRNIAIATSGPSAQFVEIDGVRYSHVIDPRSGEPLTTSRAITVLHPDPALADALATTLSVLRPAEGAALATRFGAIIVLRSP